MNNKGFMMAEVIVVASIVLLALVGFYTSYNKIISLYNKRVNYYDIDTLYDLGSIKKEYALDGEVVIEEEYRKVYYIDTTKTAILELSENNDISLSFKEYLEYISNAVTFETDKILVMEKCLNEDIDNCRYAYLEVFNEEETS